MRESLELWVVLLSRMRHGKRDGLKRRGVRRTSLGLLLGLEDRVEHGLSGHVGLPCLQGMSRRHKVRGVDDRTEAICSGSEGCGGARRSNHRLVLEQRLLLFLPYRFHALVDRLRDVLRVQEAGRGLSVHLSWRKTLSLLLKLHETRHLSILLNVSLMLDLTGNCGDGCGRLNGSLALLADHLNVSLRYLARYWGSLCHSGVKRLDYRMSRHLTLWISGRPRITRLHWNRPGLNDLSLSLKHRSRGRHQDVGWSGSRLRCLDCGLR